MLCYLVLQTTQTNAWRLRLFPVGRPFDNTIVRDAEQKPAAFSVAEIRLVAERREVFSDVFEIVALTCGFELYDLCLHISDETEDERRHLA